MPGHRRLCAKAWHWPERPCERVSAAYSAEGCYRSIRKNPTRRLRLQRRSQSYGAYVCGFPAERQRPPLLALLPVLLRDRSSPTLPLRLKGWLLGRFHFQSAHHAAEIGPTRQNHLGHMNQEESAESHGQQEMVPPRHLIPAQQRCDPVHLGGFVNRQAGNETPGAHQNYRGVSNFLCPVVLCLRWKIVTQMQVLQRHLNSFLQAFPVGNDKPPFAGQNREKHIEESVDGEDPHKEEVVPQPLGHVVGSIHCLPEPMREETDQGKRPNSYAVDRMRVLVSVIGIVPIDEQAAPDHGEEHGEIDPVHPADRERMFLVQANLGRDGRPRSFHRNDDNFEWRRSRGHLNRRSLRRAGLWCAGLARFFSV